MAIKIPSFTYTGSYKAELKKGYWYIYFLTSGTLKMTYSKTADLYLHGGGGGGSLSGWNNLGGSGGGDGWLANHHGISIGAGIEYKIVIGAGGKGGYGGTPDGGEGGASSAFGYSVQGGKGGIQMGEGGQGYSGYGGNVYGGIGDSNTTYAFDSALGLLYGGCGGGSGADGGEPYGGGPSGASALPNTGAGGGGYYYSEGQNYDGTYGTGGGDGGSGIVILRSPQDDQLPVKFEGVTLQRILFNGEEVAHLIHDGTQIFMERMRRVFEWLKQEMPLLQPAV